MPAHYKKQMLLDVYCGGQVSGGEASLQSWFSQFSAFKEGELNRSEFKQALDRLGVEAGLHDQEQAFEYFVRKVAGRTGDLLRLNKVPMAA